MIKYFLPFFALCISCSSIWHPTQKFSGTLEYTEYSLGARVAGRVATLNVNEGSVVKKGDVIATLDHFEQAKKDYDRLLALQKVGGVSDQMLEQAHWNLDDQQVVSPIDGVVLIKVHQVGEVVTAASPLVVLGESQKPWVRIYVPEGVVNQVQLNQKAELRLDGVDQVFAGHVIYIAPKAEFTPRNVQTPEERITQTYAVKVQVDQSEPVVHAGVAVDVTLESR